MGECDPSAATTREARCGCGSVAFVDEQAHDAAVLDERRAHWRAGVNVHARSGRGGLE